MNPDSLFKPTFIVIVCMLTVSALKAQTSSIHPSEVKSYLDSLLSQMSTTEKVDQLSGRSFDTSDNLRLGISGFNMVDGPLGIGQPDKNGVSTAFPASIALSSTWDKSLAYKMGYAIGSEARKKGKNVLLAPCMNIQRYFGGGRNFESFSEDPFLSSRMSVDFIKGAQNAGVVACAKHFVCNNQERNRINLNVEVSERALREIYFPSFKAAVQEANVLSVMTSYNQVNGHYSGENHWLISDVLKEEWGFKGLTISDWESIYSTKKAYFAGLDMEMPWARHFGDSLVHYVNNDDVPDHILDEKVRRILYVKNQQERAVSSDTTRLSLQKIFERNQKLTREIAVSSIVLLKNDNNILPLSEIQEIIAVVGPNAAVARIPSRGSAHVEPPYKISPLQALYDHYDDSSRILYTKGCELLEEPYTSQGVRVLNSDGEKGFNATFFNNQHLAGQPLLETSYEEIDVDWGHDTPIDSLDKDNFSIRWSGSLKAAKSGWYSLDISSYGGYKLFFSDEELSDQWYVWKPKGIESIPVHLESNRSYPLVLEYFESEWEAGIEMGVRSLENPELDTVRSYAEQSDVTLVFLGFSDSYEQEGSDRVSFNLPREQLDLLEDITETDTKVVVIVNAGTAVEMDSWINNVDAVLYAWYGGMEAGNAIVDILYGKQNPSGKLPFTYLKKYDDYSVNTTYYANDTLMVYDEGIYVGYRYFDKHDVEPLFEFGYGLSYTDFDFSNMRISDLGDSVEVRLKVKNIGNEDGHEVVQIYVGKKDTQVDRPISELKGFKKVFLRKGEEKDVIIRIGKSQLKYFDPYLSAWSFENGKYTFDAGQSRKRILLTQTIDISLTKRLGTR